MRFDLTDAPPEPLPDALVGNVYRCQGGNKTAFWVVVAADDRGVVCLGIDREGAITSSANYGRHVFEGYPWQRFPIGRVTEMPDLSFRVEWLG